MRVNSDPYEILLGGFGFVEHVSGFVIIKKQVDINTDETVKEKLNF